MNAVSVKRNFQQKQIVLIITRDVIINFYFIETNCDYNDMDQYVIEINHNSDTC